MKPQNSEPILRLKHAPAAVRTPTEVRIKANPFGEAKPIDTNRKDVEFELKQCHDVPSHDKGTSGEVTAPTVSDTQP